MTDDKPTPGEIEAYVSGQLDVERKFVVETHLSRHPEQAARVMADFSASSALKLLFGNLETADDALIQKQRNLLEGRRSFPWRRSGTLAAMALPAVMAAILWSSGPPDYVEYAVNSHRIATLRANMRSQIEVPQYDRREIASSTRIAIPALPPDWDVKDVQVFPTDKGAALVIAVTTSVGQPLSLFAIRERTDAPERPDAVREGEQSVAYWRRGDTSFALTGEAEPNAIDATAEALVRSWS